MHNDSRAAIAKRSYLPEADLIANRDFDALYVKYGCESGKVKDKRQDVIENPAYQQAIQDTPLTQYERSKQIGCLTIENDIPASFSAIDPVRFGNMITMFQQDINTLHIRRFAGPDTVRQDLSRTAAYIGLHEQVRDARLITAITYAPMAQLAARIGMRPMQLFAVTPDYHFRLEIFQRTFNAINRRHDDLRITALYMPTAEFVQRFGAGS